MASRQPALVTTSPVVKGAALQVKMEGEMAGLQHLLPRWVLGNILSFFFTYPLCILFFFVYILF